ncbi:Intraflagellar transport 54 [Carabus blaptoides fortunei]
MTEDIKPDVIQLTQTTLGSFIKKPVLSEKHLKKPPFRFLHDIVTSVIRETGFLSGLYTVLELQSENIKDRDMKIAFLQKLIDCITIVTGKSITARPSKIVAGLEPTKTNELLQAIGYALKKKLDSSNAVAQIEGGVTPSKKKSKSKDDKKSESKVKQSTSNKGTDKVSKSSKVKEGPKTKNDKQKDTGKKEKVSSRKADATENKTKVTKGESPRNITKKSPRDVKKKVIESPTAIKDKKDASVVLKNVQKEQKSLQIESPPPELSKIDTVSNNIEPEENIIEPISPEVKIDVIEMRTNAPVKETGLGEEKTTVNTSNDSGLVKDKVIVENKNEEHEMSRISAKKNTVQDDVILMPKEPLKMEHLVRPKTSLRPPSVRPSSARPAAPRLKDRHDIILLPDEIVTMGKVNVIVENFTVHEEDNEETVVVEEPPELTFQPPPIATLTDIPAEKGLLVGQILEQLGDSVSELKPRVEIEWEAGGKKNREVARKEMERLCDSIQTLTRAANPLGKLMNFLQEDMDSMRSELKMWIEINVKLSGEIKTQKRLNEESIEPLKKQLNRMDDEIVKQREQISMTHANILRNEQKIKTLITRHD